MIKRSDTMLARTIDIETLRKIRDFKRQLELDRDAKNMLAKRKALRTGIFNHTPDAA